MEFLTALGDTASWGPVFGIKYLHSEKTVPRYATNYNNTITFSQFWFWFYLLLKKIYGTLG